MIDDALQRIGGELGAGFDFDAGMLVFVRAGQRAWLQHDLVANYDWTYADAELPRGHPLVLYARPAHDVDPGLVEAGTLSPLRVGHAVFDARYYVEGAPADVVRALLDAEGRSLFARLPTAELTTLSQPGRTFLRLAVPFALASAPQAVALLDEVSAFALRVRDAYAAVAEAALATGAAGDPFRPELDASAEAAAEQARHADLVRVHSLALERTRSRAPAVVVVGVIVAILLAVLLL